MMSKGPLERRERLHRVCKSIIADPSIVDAGTVAAFKTAALSYAHTQYGAPEQVLKRLYCDEGELGDLMRGAVDIVVSKQLDNDDRGKADDVAKARTRHDVGARGLAAATSELALDLIRHHRRRLGLVAKGGGQPGKESTMDKTETLRAIAKAGGIIAVAKAIVDENRSYGIIEHEFVELATEHAKAAHPELSEAAAFSKLYEIPEVWRACNVLKSMPFVADVTPVMVGGEDTRDLSDTSKAIEQLKELGARRWPTASAADQFERALTDPANHTLARRAVPIPQPTTSYPFPR
jgi:hypothetical protein